MVIINERFVGEYYQFINKMLPVLEQNICQDNITNVRKILFDMELKYVLFKKQLMKAFRDMISGKTT